MRKQCNRLVDFSDFSTNTAAVSIGTHPSRSWEKGATLDRNTQSGLITKYRSSKLPKEFLMDHAVLASLKSPRNTSWFLLDSLFETDCIAKIWFQYSGNSDAGEMYEQVILVYMSTRRRCPYIYEFHIIEFLNKYLLRLESRVHGN